jgi:hypothetical protein
MLARKLSGLDRWMLIGSGLLLLSYFAYWHDGFYLGPRFVLPLSPWLALWTARFPAVLREWQVTRPVERAVVAGGLTALLMGVTMLVPLRAEQYRNGMLSMRFDVDALARQAGVKGALVFVRESWGSQLMARMWALGVSRSRADQFYRTVDACQLDAALTAEELEGGTGADFVRRVAPLRADSAQLVGLRVSPDTTPRVRAGSPIGGRCLRRIIEDRDGFTLLAPLLLASRDDGNVYLRDLHARDTLAIAAHPGQALFLLTASASTAGVPRIVPLSLDSMKVAWRADLEGPR